MYSLFLLSLLTSCNYFTKAKEPMAIARVGDTFLYKDDIIDLVPKGTNKKDSIAIVSTFIENWATKKIIYNAAEYNLTKKQMEDYENLIEQYKIDLYTKAYLEELVKRQIDTVISQDEIQKYYVANKQYFKNTSELVKLRYINLVKENPKFDKIRTKFVSFTKKDREELEALAIEYKSYAFNDSLWVDVNQVYEIFPFINADIKEKFIKSGINFQQVDSTTVWLVKINKVLSKEEAAPLQFLQPTIKQVILNNRKLQLVKTIEKEITNDAIKKNKYEIYK